MYLGADLVLSGYEVLANNVLMTAKHNELDTAYVDSVFPPSQHYFNSKPDIEASEVYQLLKPMPKGGVLHLHHVSITRIDWVIANLTYE